MALVRTKSVISPCGFSTKGNDREINGKLKIHNRHCDICNKNMILTSNNIIHDNNNIKRSRRGRLGKHTFEESQIIIEGNDIIKCDGVNVGNF